MKPTERMEEVYRRRQELHPRDYYSLFQPGQLYLSHRRERAYLESLRRAGLPSLQGKRILDVGCGGGEWLIRFMFFGAEPRRLTGVELQAVRARAAHRHLPAAGMAVADAAALPFPAGTFDLVHQATMMTLVLDDGVRRRIAAEMVRVLRPGGAILWFDFRYSNPRNPDARGIGAAEIRRLFPGCRVQLRSVSLLPPLARILARGSFTLCRLLEALPPLRIHWCAVIRPVA